VPEIGEIRQGKDISEDRLSGTTTAKVAVIAEHPGLLEE